MNNAGFESDLADWTLFTGTESLTSDAFAGANALALSSNGSGVDQSFSVVAGETYTLSTYGKTSAADWSGVGVRFYDAQWNELDSAETQINSSDWTEYTVDAIAPTGAVNGIYWAWKGGDTGTTTLDEFGVSGATPPPPTADNLLTNPSFEFGLTTWNAFTGTEDISSDAIDGTQSLELSTGSSGANQTIDITAGETYQLTASVKSDNDGWNGIGLRFRDSNGTPLLTEQSRITPGNWSLYDIEGTAPDNAAQAEVFIWNGGDSGSTYLDDVSFASISPPPVNQAPTITSNSGGDAATLTFEENSTADVATIEATDGDGDSLTFTLEGPDISQLSIDPNTGEISFNSAPDYERPSDSNGDNQYDVDVVVTDSQGGQDIQSLAIAVNNVASAITVDTTANRYDYDFGTPDSPLGTPNLQSGNRPTTWQRISPETEGDISWSDPVSAVDRGTISRVNTINQDNVYSSEARTLSHKISNGVWDIVVNMGDATATHDQMQVSAEGIVLNTDLNSGIRQFPYGGGRVEVTDGVLDLTFSDLGGTDPNWVLNRLSLTKVGELGEAVIVDTSASRYDYDFGTPDSPLASSALQSARRPTTWQRISPKTVGDISWSAPVEATDRGAGSGVNAINQDFVSSSGVRTLSHKISNGVWDVAVNMGDATAAHDNMRISAEGVVINGDIDNGVRQFPYGLGRVAVTDGVLDLKFEDLGGTDPNWVLNRLSLTNVGGVIGDDGTIDTSASQYYYDFGTATSPVSSDFPGPFWQRISPDTTGDIRWSGEVNAADRGEGTNDVNRDFVYASGSRTLTHKIDNGLWQVTLGMGDADFAHDRMQVSVEGNILSSSVDRLFLDDVATLPNEYNSAAGQIRSVGGQRIFVTDGELDITFNDLGGDDPNWVVNSLSLVKILDLPDAEESTPGLATDGSGFTQTTLATGFERPTAFAYADDGRVFVSEKAGRIKVVENGEVVSTFIDISDEVDSTRDRGLIGFALDPDFDTNGWVYFHFSEAPTGDNVAEDGYGVGGQLIKVKASAENPNVADLSTRTVILGGHLTTGGSHTVGDVDFDNDGNLIFSWGDGGFSQDLRLAAQNPDSQQGKFFRVDPETGLGVPENPYYDPANPDSIRSKVWVTGVRNAWRWTVDRLTGDVYFGDVKDGDPEEANIIRANTTEPEQLNFGWPYFEGDNPTRYGTPPSGFESASAYIELPHVGRYDAITGGAVYRGSAYPEIYDGRYFFANFGQDVFYTADADGNFQQFGSSGDFRSPADIQVAPNGTIQYLSMFDGAFYQLNYDPSTNQPLIPNAEATASVTAGAGPLTVNFSSAGSNSPNGDTLTYGWDFDSDGSIDSTAANPNYTYDTVGKQTATLTVIDGAGAVDTTEVEVTITSSQPTDGNLAFGKPTIQSSTTQGAIASRAVDGNTDDSFINGSVTATAVQDKAFWEIDLGAVYDLSSVQIFVGSQPLSNYFVFTSEEELVGGNFNALFTEPGVWYYQNQGEVTDEETVAINQTARYLRIQVADIGVVSLAEVKILGEPI